MRALVIAMVGVCCVSVGCRAPATSGPRGGADRLPIIDMHLHAHLLAEYGGGGRVCTSDQAIEFPPVDPRQPITLDRVLACAKPVASAATDDAVMRESLALLEKRNILAVTSGPLQRSRDINDDGSLEETGVRSA